MLFVELRLKVLWWIHYLLLSELFKAGLSFEGKFDLNFSRHLGNFVIEVHN